MAAFARHYHAEPDRVEPVSRHAQQHGPGKIAVRVDRREQRDRASISEARHVVGWKPIQAGGTAMSEKSMKEKFSAGELVLCMNLRLARSVDIAMVAKAGGYDALYV